MKYFLPAGFAIFALLSGCAHRQEAWRGPERLAKVDVTPWVTRDAPASILKSRHYWIYTTLPQGRQRDALTQVLEGAYEHYQAFAPAGPIDPRPMSGYVFARRDEWSQFTARKTGGDAAMYEHITRGGYTIDDWFAVHALDEPMTLSAVSHEGWHQYAARHFRSRLPPFLEEGIACLFEHVRMADGLPRWNTTENPGRSSALRAAARAKRLWPLGVLITLHAGEVVDRPEAQEAFYAQSWAFARFLLEAEDGRYRPMLRRLLADAAAGAVRDPGGTPRAPVGAWDSSGTRAVLEHYLERDFAAIEQSFDNFVTRLTLDGDLRHNR